jgi:hypothetical protein
MYVDKHIYGNNETDPCSYIYDLAFSNMQALNTFFNQYPQSFGTGNPFLLNIIYILFSSAFKVNFASIPIAFEKLVLHIVAIIY